MSEKEQLGYMDGFEVDPGNVKETMKRLGASSRDMRMVPYEALHALPGFNKRDMTPEYEDHIAWLTDSMMEHGFKDDCPIPVIVQREGDKEVVYYTGGHTRMVAVGRARARGKSIQNIPVIAKPRGTNKIDLWVSQVTDNTASRHTLRELGEIYYELGRLGLSTKDIAQKMARSEQHVKDALDTRSWPEKIKEAVIEGKISPTAALELVRQHGMQQAISKLEDGLQQAKQTGRARVTQKSFSGPRIPPRISASVVTAVETFIAGLDEPIREALSAIDPEIEKRQGSLISGADANGEPQVSVPASLLRELMRAHEDIERVRTRAAKREEKAKARAASETGAAETDAEGFGLDGQKPEVKNAGDDGEE